MRTHYLVFLENQRDAFELLSGSPVRVAVVAAKNLAFAFGLQVETTPPSWYSAVARREHEVEEPGSGSEPGQRDAESKFREVLKKLATQKAFRTKVGFHSREETSLARSLKLSLIPSREALPSNTGTAAPGESCDQGDDEHHQEDEEQEFRDSGCCNGNSAETKDRRPPEADDQAVAVLQNAICCRAETWRGFVLFNLRSY